MVLDAYHNPKCPIQRQKHKTLEKLCKYTAGCKTNKCSCKKSDQNCRNECKCHVK